MTVRRSLPLVLVLGLVAGLLVGCSDRSALIPANDAAALRDDIDAVAEALDRGRCEDLSSAVSQLQLDATNLPEEVDRRLRKRVEDGVTRAASLAPTECLSATTTETTPTTDTSTLETVPPTTETIPTAPVETTPTAPVETTPTDPTIPDGTGGESSQGDQDGFGGDGQ
jgi:hypothetical protein